MISGWFDLLKITAAAVAVAGGLAIVAPHPVRAGAGDIRVVDGEAFWKGDPGLIDPGAYWTSGLYKYDPNGYLEQDNRFIEQAHRMTVYANHSGKARCVFRKRVIISTWESLHPYIRVCRP